MLLGKLNKLDDRQAMCVLNLLVRGVGYYVASQLLRINN